MKKYTSIGLSVLVLAGVVLGMLLWARTFRAAVYGYRSPLRESDLSPASLPLTTTHKVVIVLISGLGYDDADALNLPTLAQLRRVGANAAAQSVPPTYSQTAWAAIISGAPPDTNDAPPVDLPVDKLRLLDVDTLFSRAHAARLRVALFGPDEWRRLLPRNQLDIAFFVERPGVETDQFILEAALPLLKNNETDLALLHFTQIKAAAGGVSGPAYQQAAVTLDGYLAQISAAIDLRQTTLVVASDHGRTASGGYGGDEVEVTWQPLVMVGDSIVPGNYSDISQLDLAPTLATLLGVSPPGAAQGRILLEMLRLPEANRVTAQFELAQQRVKLAQAYLTVLNGDGVTLPAGLTADLTQAQSIVTSNPDGAFQLAKLVQQQADAQLTAAKNSRLRAEKWPRLALATLVSVVWLNFMWRRRGFHAASILMAVMLTGVLYHALYQLQGHSYSLSSLTDAYMSNFDRLPLDIAARVAVSLLAGGGLLLFFFMLTDEGNWLVLLGSGYGFSVLATFIFMLPFGWAFWQNGFVPTWHLPEVGPVFWQVSSAFESLSAAALGLLLPWPVLCLSLLIHHLRRRLSQTPEKRPAAGGQWSGGGR